jgi:SAM-dependent methyltransferase
MVDTIDYYDYWNKQRSKPEWFHRDKVALDLISSIIKPTHTFLDAGCGNGYFIQALLKKHPQTKAKGLDYSKLEVKEAKAKGLDVNWGNLEKGIKLKSESINIAYAAEVIEHLYNPDFLLEELNRILKPEGHVIITTPNLLAWFNRILAPIGIQPLFLEPSTKSKLVGAGPLKRFKQGHQPVGHIRVFTLAAIKDLFKMHGFEILKIRGSSFDEGFPKKVLAIDKLFNPFPKLASRFVILAKKVN